MTGPVLEASSTLSAIEERERTSLMSTYARLPIALREGRGCTVVDTDGREYLDMVAGIAVSVLGHAHPAVLSAVEVQARRVIHLSNLYFSEPQLQAAERLIATAFPSRAFLCNSGAEAVEAAIKLARKWGRVYRGGAGTVICARGAFHGRTLGALAATANRRYKDPFEPLPRGFVHVGFDSLAEVEAAVDDATVAVLMEPIEGESGVNPMSDTTLRGLRRLCDERDLLLILDEVQSGMGRTGRWWAHQHSGAVPDVMAVAKGLGGGLPIGAVLAAPRADVFEPGDHGSTFGGGPLVSAVAAAVIDAIEKDSLVENAAATGQRLRSGLVELAAAGAPIAEVRGRGLMLGVVLTREIAARVVRAALDQLLIVNACGPSLIRLVPALVLTEAEADEAVRRFALALEAAG
ncbi:MAG TPA: acetylornithine transaminase [Candidatus Binatia bacterium]|nr:acetylornithine transaminase [Candidatus Binatia bacterium]